MSSVTIGKLQLRLPTRLGTKCLSIPSISTSNVVFCRNWQASIASFHSAWDQLSMNSQYFDIKSCLLSQLASCNCVFSLGLGPVVSHFPVFRLQMLSSVAIGKLQLRLPTRLRTNCLSSPNISTSNVVFCAIGKLHCRLPTLLDITKHSKLDNPNVQSFTFKLRIRQVINKKMDSNTLTRLPISTAGNTKQLIHYVEISKIKQSRSYLSTLKQPHN